MGGALEPAERDDEGDRVKEEAGTATPLAPGFGGETDDARGEEGCSAGRLGKAGMATLGRSGVGGCSVMAGRGGIEGRVIGKGRFSSSESSSSDEL